MLVLINNTKAWAVTKNSVIQQHSDAQTCIVTVTAKSVCIVLNTLFLKSKGVCLKFELCCNVGYIANLGLSLNGATNQTFKKGLFEITS